MTDAIYLEPLARNSDPETSHLAAESARDLQAQHQRMILNALRKYGASGKDRIGALTGLSGVAVARRLTELQRRGAIIPTGRKVQSMAGRLEREWSLA